MHDIEGLRQRLIAAMKSGHLDEESAIAMTNIELDKTIEEIESHKAKNSLWNAPIDMVLKALDSKRGEK